MLAPRATRITMVCFLTAERHACNCLCEDLREKYHCSDVNAEGWITFVPQPDNAVNAAQANGRQEGFAVRGQWGDEQPNGDFLQYGEDGDYVLQSKTDPDVVWIVKRELFEATYDFAT